ncbi:MAG: IS30 family transposase, partial [Enterococcus gallinarum]
IIDTVRDFILYLKLCNRTANLLGRQPQETRGKFNIGSLSKRPKSVRSRQEFGHWELGTIVSSRGKSTGCLATFAERKSRLYIAFLIPNRTKDAMHSAIEKLTRNLPEHALESFTSDRGKEFACYPDVEASGIDFYFADAYSAWQRGTNENSNGLMSEFFPKKTDLATVSETELFTALWLMNNRPRKYLNYQTPLESFMHETSLIE